MLKEDISNRTLEFLGESFPLKLFYSIIGEKVKVENKVYRDDKFGHQFLKVAKLHHFAQNGLYYELMRLISDFYGKYQQVPFYDEIELLIKTSKNNDTTKKSLLVLLKSVYELKDDVSYSKQLVNETALNFIRFQNLLFFSKEVQNIAYSGHYDQYNDLIDKLTITINNGDVEENHYITSPGNYDDLVNPRTPIPIGWGDGFDKALNGGLARGELMILILGSGVGKTTLATIAPDHIVNLGLNVVQIFFEDTTTQIRQKQRAKWTGLPINQINKKDQRPETVDFIKKVSDEKISKANEKGGHWILKKFKSTGTTVNDLRRYLAKLRDQYKIQPHFVIIDYLECFDVEVDRFDDDWKKEKTITRHLESIASEDEFNVAMIAFTQGNRGAMNNEMVDVTEMGGDFAKYKIGHVVASMAKTHEMKRRKTANAAILKSRVGADGIVFKDFLFDNSTMKINITSQSVEGTNEGEVTTGSKNFARKK